jgi:hypothetical protein
MCTSEAMKMVTASENPHANLQLLFAPLFTSFVIEDTVLSSLARAL